MVTSTVDTIQLSIGISQATKDWLEEQSDEFDVPREQIIERLVEESVRMRRHPRISFREEGPRRRACIRGTRFDVWYVIDGLREMGRERILNESSLSSYDLDAAEAYYQCYTDEIDREIEYRMALLEDLAKNYEAYGIEIVRY
jgi:uncharacterized protein (DUF433 family)